MTKEEALEIIKKAPLYDNTTWTYAKELHEAINVLEQEPIDKSAMMYEIYMEGVNMTGEYQGCWVRFKDIEKIVNKYMAESEESDADIS